MKSEKCINVIASAARQSPDVHGSAREIASFLAVTENMSKL